MLLSGMNNENPPTSTWLTYPDLQQQQWNSMIQQQQYPAPFASIENLTAPSRKRPSSNESSEIMPPPPTKFTKSSLEIDKEADEGVERKFVYLKPATNSSSSFTNSSSSFDEPPFLPQHIGFNNQSTPKMPMQQWGDMPWYHNYSSFAQVSSSFLSKG